MMPLYLPPTDGETGADQEPDRWDEDLPALPVTPGPVDHNTPPQPDPEPLPLMPARAWEWDLEEEKRMSTTDDTELTYVDGYNAGYAAGLRSGRKKGEQAAAEATRELHRVQEVARAQRAALDAVLEMHFKSVDGWCAFDDEQYPCSTIHEIESHLRRGGVA